MMMIGLMITYRIVEEIVERYESFTGGGTVAWG